MPNPPCLLLLGKWGSITAGLHIWPIWAALALSGEIAAFHSLNSAECHTIAPFSEISPAGDEA